MEQEEKVMEITEQERRQKMPFTADRAEYWLLLLAALFGYLAVRFSAALEGGLLMVLLCGMVYAVTLGYCRIAKLALVWNADTLILSGITLALILPYALFDLSGIRTLWLFLALVPTMAVQLYSMLGARRYRFREKEYVQDWVDAVFVMPFANLGASWLTLGKGGKNGAGKNILLALVGFVIAIPLSAVLLSLLFEADAAFSNLLRAGFERFSETVSAEISYILFGIPTAMVAFGVLYGLRYRSGLQKAQAPGTKRSRRIPVGIAAGVLTPVVVIYGTYLVSQLAYFTSAFSGLLPENFTYAEYARQGFFELCGICVINLSLTVAVLAFVKAGKIFRRVFGSFFCVISLFLTATAAAKMVLYMRSYGLTTMRLYTSLFMVVLGLTFLYILLRLYWEKLPITQLLFLTVAAAVLIFAYTDAEAVTLQYNVNAIQENRLTESEYFAGFSREELLYMDDGIEPILREYQTDRRVQSLLKERQKMREERDWSRWNLQSALVRKAK